jgi:hypothetical protein
MIQDIFSSLPSTGIWWGTKTTVYPVIKKLKLKMVPVGLTNLSLEIFGSRRRVGFEIVFLNIHTFISQHIARVDYD